MEIAEEIAAHYGEVSEQERLTTQPNLEYLRTRELLDRFLPPPPAVVLDVGGAAGVYALPLAAAGYEVHLVDPVAKHLVQARVASDAQRSAPLAGIARGDARRLAWDDASANAVLLLGPLYHLTERPDRLAALAEARRVVRPGGPVLVAAISRFASTHDGVRSGALDVPGFEEIVRRDVATGQHRNTTSDQRFFTTAFFHHPDELAAEVTDAGLTLDAVLAVEGPGGWMDLTERLADPASRERILTAIRRVEAEPSLLGASSHLMAVARG